MKLPIILMLEPTLSPFINYNQLQMIFYIHNYQIIRESNNDSHHTKFDSW